jgi:hypothetical protein
MIRQAVKKKVPEVLLMNYLKPIRILKNKDSTLSLKTQNMSIMNKIPIDHRSTTNMEVVKRKRKIAKVVN